MRRQSDEGRQRFRHRAGLHAGLPALLAVLATTLAATGCRRPEAPPEEAPRLILLVVVDQFTGDYAGRFGHLFSGGLRHLLERGAVFTDAHQRHALTLTGPGHASLASGCHPSRHGIVANYWYDRERRKQVYAVDDERHEVSPANLLVSTLGDWLKGHDRLSKVYGVSPKDRSAVLLAGHQADAAYWYDDEDGEWTSSAYYPRQRAGWLDDFHRQRLLDAHFGKLWEPLPLGEEATAGLGVEEFDRGPLAESFPHVFGGLSAAPDEDFYEDLWYSPWLDLYQVRFAQRLIEAERLGSDRHVDLLALGFSALDAVGHRYGPQSREVLDMVLRLDQRLGELLDFLDERVGLERVVVGFSSDHGSVPVPELRLAAGLPGRRAGAEEILCWQRLREALVDRFGDERWFLSGLVLDPDALARTGVSRAALEEAVSRRLAECPSVARVWTRSELEAGGGDEAHAALFFNSYHPARSPDFLVDFDEYFAPTRGAAATHGSGWRYDTWVPFVVMGPGVAPAIIGDAVATVDMAPTLAALAGIPVPETVDGADLTPNLGPTPPPEAADRRVGLPPLTEEAMP